MNKPEELYEGLPKEVGTTYRKEAIDKYGRKTVEITEAKLMAMGKSDYQKLKRNLDEISQKLFQPNQLSAWQLAW